MKISNADSFAVIRGLGIASRRSIVPHSSCHIRGRTHGEKSVAIFLLRDPVQERSLAALTHESLWLVSLVLSQHSRLGDGGLETSLALNDFSLLDGHSCEEMTVKTRASRGTP